MDSLPHLETIFNKLRRGYHFTPEDGAVFRPLWERFDEYERLLGSLGLDLRKHPQNVVYLVANDNVQPGTQAKKMGLFMMVLIEHFGETHSSIVPSLFDAVFRIEDLPHLKKARYEEYMNAIGIHDTEDLRRVVRSMDRFGFAEDKSNGFKLRTAAYRFLDLCREASELGEKASDPGESASDFDEDASDLNENAPDGEEQPEAKPEPNGKGIPPAGFASLNKEEDLSSEDLSSEDLSSEGSSPSSLETEPLDL